jgi:succinate dehydrogenase / fumarate reductase cytochrome b subunit
VWTTWHLYANLTAFDSPARWESTVTGSPAPFVEIVTSAVVLFPLVFHTVWGLRRLRIMKANNTQYKTFDNLKFLLQRLSAIGLLGFLIAHIWKARLEPMIEHGRHETFRDIAWHMHHHPPTFIVYLLGVLAVAYHLSNGLATGAITWGLAATAKSQERVKQLSYVFFALLLGMGYASIYGLWSAGEFPRRDQREYYGGVEAPVGESAPAAH